MKETGKMNKENLMKELFDHFQQLNEIKNIKVQKLCYRYIKKLELRLKECHRRKFN